MRILLINDYLEPVGGAEVYVLALRDKLEEEGHEVYLFTSEGDDESYKKNLSHKSIFKLVSLIFNFYYYMRVKKIIKGFKPDVIHIHGIFNELSPSILLAIDMLPVIMTVHDLNIVSAVSIQSQRSGGKCKKEVCEGCVNCVGLIGMIYEKIKRLIHKQLLNKINLYICPSYYMKSILNKSHINNVKVIHNGANLPKFVQHSNAFNLLYVGRLVEEKGVDILLKAVAIIVKEYASVKVTIAGSGEAKHGLLLLCNKLKLDKHVSFTGNIDKTTVNKLYTDSGILLVPSIYPDNYPTVCIEAMGSGMPIIGSSVGGIPELVIDKINGLLVKAGDFEELSEKIIFLLKNKIAYKEMCHNSHKLSYLYDMHLHVNTLLSEYSFLKNSLNRE